MGKAELTTSNGKVFRPRFSVDAQLYMNGETWGPVIRTIVSTELKAAACATCPISTLLLLLGLILLIHQYFVILLHLRILTGVGNSLRCAVTLTI